MLISVSMILENIWSIYKNHWRKFIIFSAFLFIPTLAASVLGLVGVITDSLAPNSQLFSNVLTAIILVAGLVFYIWSTIALALALNTIIKQEAQARWQAVYNEAAPKIWPFIYTNVLSTLIIIGGTILLIIPGIIFAVWYAFVTYSVVLSGKAGFMALKDSKALVTGRWWAIVWRLVAPGFVLTVISAAIRVIVLIVPMNLLVNNLVLSQLVDNVLTALVTCFVAPAAAASVILLYHSAKNSPVKNEFAPPVNS